MKSVDAESVAEEMVKMYARVDLPEEILTDQGSNFTCQLLAEMYRLLHVHSTRTSPNRRSCCTIQPDSEVDASEGGDPGGYELAKMIPYVLFAHREVPQSCTGFSPFERLMAERYGTSGHHKGNMGC